MTLEKTLNERGRNYGDFTTQAQLAQSLKQVMVAHGMHQLKPFQRESLEMIQHKISRILNGDPNYVDSWDDIAGYALIVAERLRKGVTNATAGEEH